MRPLLPLTFARFHLRFEGFDTSSALLLARVALFGCLAAVALLLLPAVAWSGGAKGTRLKSYVSKSDDAVGIVVRVTSGSDTPCDGTARKGGRKIDLPAVITGPGGEGQWSWHIAPGVPAGKWRVVAQCTRSTKVVQHAHIDFVASGGGGRRRDGGALYVRKTLDNRPVGAQASGGNGAGELNLYPYGQCTWYVATRRPDLPYFEGRSGDALRWITSAQQAKPPLSTGETPAVGAVAVFQPNQYGAGRYGHVAYVEHVDGSKITISEANYKHKPRNTRTIPWARLNFIYPPRPPAPPEPAQSPLAPLSPAGDSSKVVTARWQAGSSFGHPLYGLVNDVGMDANGDVFAMAEVGTSTGGFATEVTKRSADTGMWEEPQIVSDLDGRAGQLVVDPQGNATLVWTLAGRVRSATRPAGNPTWDPAVNVSNATDSASSPRVAVGAHGDLTAVWTRTLDGNASLQSATRPAGTDRWQAPQDLPFFIGFVPGREAADGHVSVAADGDATAIWRQVGLIAASRRNATTGIWERPQALAPDGATDPRVAVNERGDATAVWVRSNGINTTIRTSTRDAISDIWQSARDLSVAGQNARSPQVAIDAQADATAVWLRSNGTIDVVQASTRAGATGIWEAPTDLSDDKSAGAFGLGINARGDVIAAWDRWNANIPGLLTNAQARTRRGAAGTWSGVVDLPGQHPMYNDGPKVAVDNQGNGVTVWRGGDPGPLWTAGYDAAGPRLSSSLGIPSTGVVGTMLPFSVAPTDVWSSLGPTTWSFGDGTSTDGTTVSHAYTRPGSYSVTVTSADVLGNSSSSTRTIVISSAAEPPPATETLTPSAASDAITLSLKSKSANIDAKSGKGTVPAMCSAPPGQSCVVKGTIYGPGKIPPGTGTNAKQLATQIGTVHGTVRAGKRGTLVLRLKPNPRAQLRHHRLTAQLVGEITDRHGDRTRLRGSLILLRKV